MLNSIRRWRSVAGWVLVSFAVAAPTSDPGSLPANSLPQVTPAANPGLSRLGGNLAQSYTMLVGSCFNTPMPTGMSGMAGVGMGMAGMMGMGMSGMAQPSCPMSPSMISISSPCVGSDQVPNFNNLDCSTMSPMAVKQAEAMLQGAFCTIQCEQNKAQAIQSELQCLHNASGSMSLLSNSLTTEYQNAIVAAQQNVMKFQQAYQDNEAKSQYIGDLLNGPSNGQGGSSGSGMLAMKKQLQDQLAAMPQTLLQGQNDYKQYQQHQGTLNSLVQTRTAALMNQCFSQSPSPSYRCSPTGPQVSPAAYLVCRYQQTQMVGSNGLVEQNNVIENKAQAGAQSLQSLLDQMSSYAASNSGIPTGNGDLASGNTNNAVMISSPIDVDRFYGSQLAGYRIGGQTARDFVLGVMKNCYARAENEVAAEKANPGSAIGLQLNQLQTQLNTVHAELTLHYQNLSQLYSDVTGAMSGGRPAALNAPSCASGNPQTQLSCMGNVQKELQGLLVGTARDSRVTLQIRGNNPGTYQNVTCSGLNGCIAALQSGQRSIQANQATIQSQQRQFVLDQNQQILSVTKAQAAQLSMASANMNQQLSALNSAIASLGGTPFNVPPVRGESLANDSTTGLYNPPNNAFHAVAQFVQPPLPDLSGAGVSGGLGSALQNVNARAAKVSEQMVAIQTLLPSCQMQRSQRLLDQVSGMTPSGCFGHQYCDNNAQRLVSEIQQITARLGHNPQLSGSLAQLSSGVVTACEDPLQGQVDAELISITPGLSGKALARQRRGAQGQRVRAELTRMDPRFGAPQGCQAYFGSILGLKNLLAPANSPSGGYGHSAVGR